MDGSGSGPASNRRMWVAFGVTAVLCAVPVVRAQQQTQTQQQTQGQQQTGQQQTGQQTGQPAQGQQAPAQPDLLKFTADTAMIVNFVKPDKAADFEASWVQIKNKLEASDKPDIKALGDSLMMYKVDAQTPNGVFYVFYLNPPSKTNSYSPTAILYDSGAFTREEADTIFAKLKDCYQQIQPWPLVKIG
jgi:hypothetical protein